MSTQFADKKQYRSKFRGFLRTYKKHLIRYGLLSANLIALVVVAVFVIHTSGPGDTANQQNSITPNPSPGSATIANPLDKLSAADIAVNIARMTGIYEQQAVVNNADTVRAEMSIASSGQALISKPQVVATDAKTRRDIEVYVTKPGDTVSALAVRYGVTSDSIRWSNDLSEGVLPAGKRLYIPPVNGIVYTVKSGDTAKSLANKYSASASAITSFNDAELTGLKKGERIVIPGGSKPAPVYSYYYGGYAWGSGAIYGYNGYDYGNCTWYVATHINMPANWGNASTWDNYAYLTPGWTVGTSPRVGSIAQTDYAAGGLGHVAIVDAIAGNQIHVSEMNHLGWNIVDNRWVAASEFQHYIYR